MAVRAPRLPDAEGRRRAAGEFGCNLVVLAGAGTGKTSLLVERVLGAVGAGVLTIDQLAALTFTEKAAGEMRERVAVGLGRLHGWTVAPDCPPDPATIAGRVAQRLQAQGLGPTEIGARALQAIESLERATIETIHGFCSALLRAHPVEAGVDPGFSVDAGEQADLMRRQIWASFVAAELGPAAPRADLWRELLPRLPLASVGELARALADFVVDDAWLEPSSWTAPRELLAREVASVVADIDELLRRQRRMTDLAVGIFESTRAALAAMSDEGLVAFRDRVQADRQCFERLRRGAPTPNTRLEGVSKDEMRRVGKRMRRLTLGLLDVDEATMRLVVEAAGPYVREYRESFLRAGFISFDGLLALSRDLLRDHPDVRRRVKRRYRMLLVDEFQDTDPLQYEIVLFLAEELDEAGPSAYSARPQPGRLFVVGDAKQSIYRFRGADYGAYRGAVDRILGTGGVEIRLTANFRSVPGVIDPVNRLFTEREGGCWEASDYQPGYVSIRSVRQPDDDAPRVEVWTSELPEGVRAEQRRDAEGELIAAEIERLVRRDEACRFGDVTLLFRAFTELSHYLRPLREREVPFVVDGGRDFLVRPEVQQLMSALRTLTQPDDARELLAFLRSPAGGLSDVELVEYSEGAGPWDWRREVDAARFPRVAERFDMLRELARETRDLPVDAVIRRVLERTLLLPLGAAAFEGPQRVANLRKLAAAAGELARDGRLSLEQVVEALREGRLAEIESDAPLADESVDAVRITSIHRMKGLENAWIFVPDLARGEQRGRRDDSVAKPARFVDGTAGLALGVRGCWNAAALRRELEDERHGAAEETRVLYVALTRARERLVLLVGPSRGAAPWIEALRPWGYDPAEPPPDGALLCDGAVLHRRVTAERSTHQRPHTLPLTADEARRRFDLAVERLRAARPPLVAPSARAAVDGGEGTASGFATRGRSRDLARAAGIAVHRLLEMWDGGAREPTLARLQTICDLVAGTEGVAAGALRAEAAPIVTAFLDSPLADRWRAVERLGREVPMLLRDRSGQVWRGHIDLLYSDGPGNVAVVDFKTDLDGDAEQLRSAYGEQLRAYVEATRQALELLFPPRGEIWALRHGSIVPVDPL